MLSIKAARHASARLINLIPVSYRRIGSAISVGALALGLGGCFGQTVGEGTRSVACESFTFVWLSHNDTPGTVKQVAGNNGAWVALCGKPVKP